MNSVDDALLETLAGHLRTVESILANSAWHADETAQALVRETWAAFHGTLNRHGRQSRPAGLQPLLLRAEKLVEGIRATILVEGIEEAKKMLERSAATRAESTYLYSQQPTNQPSRIDFKG